MFDGNFREVLDIADDIDGVILFDVLEVELIFNAYFIERLSDEKLFKVNLVSLY